MSLSIGPSLCTAAISSILKVPGSVGRLNDTASLSPETQQVIIKREALNIGLNGVGAFFIDVLLKRVLQKTVENPKIKAFLPLLTILPIYIATEFISRKFYPVADAIDSEVHHMPATFGHLVTVPEDTETKPEKSQIVTNRTLNPWQRFQAQHPPASVVYQA